MPCQKINFRTIFLYPPTTATASSNTHRHSSSLLVQEFSHPEPTPLLGSPNSKSKSAGLDLSPLVIGHGLLAGNILAKGRNSLD